MTLEQKVKNRPFVFQISDERPMGDGIWAILKDGYTWDGCSAVHETSWSGVLKTLREVKEKR